MPPAQTNPTPPLQCQILLTSLPHPAALEQAALPSKYPFQLHGELPPPTLPWGAGAAATPPAKPLSPSGGGAAATPQPPLAPLPRPPNPTPPSLLSHPSRPPTLRRWGSRYRPVSSHTLCNARPPTLRCWAAATPPKTLSHPAPPALTPPPNPLTPPAALWQPLPPNPAALGQPLHTNHPLRR